MASRSVSLFGLMVGGSLVSSLIVGSLLIISLNVYLADLATRWFVDDVNGISFDYREEFEEALINGSQANLVEVLDRISLRANVNYITARVDDKAVTSHFGLIEGVMPSASQQFGDDGDATYYVALPLIDGSGELLVGFDETNMTALLQSVRLAAVLCVLPASLAVLIIAWQLSGFVRRRVTVLVDMAHGIASGVASPQVDLKISEINELAESMHIMEAQLSQRQTAMLYMAEHDSLTGIANRHAFNSRLDEALSELQNHRLALLLIDIDRFKQINDAYGHPFGDRVICWVAKRMQRYGKHSDCVARIGGDEFALLVRYKDDAELDAYCRGLLSTLNGSVLLDGVSLPISLCVGVATASAESSISAERIIKRADNALYNAKRTDISVSYHDEDLFLQNQRFQKIIRALKEEDYRADSGGLNMLYQPKFDLKTGAVLGVEALVRWDHPQIGFIEALDIIEAATQCAMLDQVTHQILDHIIKQMCQWRKDGFLPKVAINIAPSEITNKHFSEYLIAQLKASDLAPENIEIEITEHAILNQDEGVYQALQGFKNQGFTIAIDDFGVGYANFRNLRDYPFTALKIDRAFVSELLWNERDKVIIQATIQVAKELGMEVIAEGVEDINSIAALLDLGCVAAQGYLFSMPIDGEAFTRLSRANKVPELLQKLAAERA